jgi:uncharacterized protein YejL (UPF0352 family)
LASLFAGYGERAKSPIEWLLFVLGLIATLVVTGIVTKAARSALDRIAASTPPDLP